jgi:hypothetical protein
MMKTRLLQLTWAVALSAAIGMPVVTFAADSDQDGIDDALETTGGAGLPFGGFTYPPCAAGTLTIAQRNACLSPTSKDIFVYLVTTANGGFLASNGLIRMSAPVDVSVLFQFISSPNVATTTGKVDGLGVGIHAAVVNTLPTNRTVGSLGQQAVVMTVDESASAYVFGKADVGTPTNTGNVTIWPVYIKNYLNKYVFGGVDTPSVWKLHVQRTASHELGHASALTANFNSKLGQYHYATGSGTVMDDSVVCDSRKKTCVIYNDYASGDKPCLLGLVSPTTNPLQCTALVPVFQ